MEKVKITIEKEDWLKYLKDKVNYSLNVLKQINDENKNPQSSQYLEGQITTMRNIELIISQLIDDGWNKENIINNFYILKMKDKSFEKKYKKIWKK